MDVEGEGDMIINATNISVSPLSLEYKQMKYLGTQVNQRTNNTIDFL